MTTGDPNTDAIIIWLTTGMNISSGGAVLAISTALRYMIIPTIKSFYSKKTKVDLGGVPLLIIVFSMAIIIAGTIGVITKAPINATNILILAVTTTLSSVGLHSVGKTVFNGNTDEQKTNDTNGS